MTREEAVIILDGFKNNPLFSDTHVQAFDMAISALKKNESAEEWYKLLCEKWDEGDWICHAPKGMTNGEVIISLYPNLKYTVQNSRVITTIGVASSFDLEWWNAPYQKGGEV